MLGWICSAMGLTAKIAIGGILWLIVTVVISIIVVLVLIKTGVIDS